MSGLACGDRARPCDSRGASWFRVPAAVLCRGWGLACAGDSVPGNDFSVANLAYLNLDDVLLDYVTFIDWYKQKVRRQRPLHDVDGCWMLSCDVMSCATLCRAGTHCG